MRRMTTLTTAATLSAGLLIAAPTAVADTGSTTSQLPLSCRAVPSAFAGPQDNYVPPIDVTVTSPDTVDIGEELTVNVHMNIQDTPAGSSSPTKPRMYPGSKWTSTCPKASISSVRGSAGHPRSESPGILCAQGQWTRSTGPAG